MAYFPDITPTNIHDMYMADQQAINAFHESQLKQKKAEIENQYAPQAAQADIDYKNALTKYSGIQSQYYPQDIQSQVNSRNALARKTNQEVDNPLLGGTGLGSDEANLQWISDKYGKDSPQYKMALDDRNQKIVNANAMNNYRNMGGARGAGVDQKALIGFANQLKTDHPEWTPNQVNDAANQYLADSETFSTGDKLPPLGGQAQQLKTVMQNKNAPAAVRNQAANMSVLASDINDIDIAPMAQFTGPKGKAEYARNLTAMATGGEVSPQFRDYEAFKQVTSNFAMDALRKGFGTSVVPSYVYSTLGRASNPIDSWWNDPEQVMKEWNATKKWVNDNAKKYTTLSTKGVGAKLTTDNSTENNKRVIKLIINPSTGKLEYA